MEYDFNNSLILIVFITILGQIIFPINIIYGLLNKKDRTNS